MRFIPQSGGWEFGPARGPWLDIIPVPHDAPNDPRSVLAAALAGRYHPRPISVAEAEKVILGGAEWHRWPWPGMLVSPAVAGMVGVIGIAAAEGVSVRFLFHRGQDPVAAMREIEEAEDGNLPPGMTAAALAAALSRRHPVRLGPMAVARACAAVAPVTGLTHHPLSRRDLEGLARHFFTEIPRQGRIAAPAGAVDRARFWLTVARLAWEPETQRFLATHCPDAAGRADMVALLLLAAGWLEMRAECEISVSGCRLRVANDEHALMMAWLQNVEFVRGAISPEALRFLLPGGEMPHGIHSSAVLPNPALASGLAAALLREAEERGVYVPQGAFVLALPERFPLREACDRLRVWAWPGGFWVAMVRTDGQIGVAFEWRPGAPLSRWVVPEEAEPLLQAILAALWHDLRVAGEEAVPRRGAAPRVGAERPRPATERPASQRRSATRVLPARRYVRVEGERDWGEAEERQRIVRRAHAVRGHLRRLPEGWHMSDGARWTATEFDIVVPYGFTFVRPHIRGGHGAPADAEGAETVIRARGLASVMTLLST